MAVNEASLPFTSFVKTDIDHNSTRIKPSLSASELSNILKENNAKRIKAALRNGHWAANDPIRKDVWLKILQLKHGKEVSIYRDSIKDVFGSGDGSSASVNLPKFIDPLYMSRYHLTDEGFHLVKRIMCVLNHTNPDITSAPAIFPMAALLLHYMPEEDVYNSICSMLKQRSAYIAQTKQKYQASALILKELCKKYSKSFCKVAQSRNLVLDEILSNWLSWLLNSLPFDYQICIMDCYLYEGPKVFYRYTLAILNLYMLKTGKQGSNAENILSPAHINLFCSDIASHASIDKLTKAAFGLRGLSKSNIRKLAVKCEMLVKSEEKALTKSVSLGDMHLKVSRSYTPLIQPDSGLIDANQWQIFWGWLPARISLMKPKRIFSTSTDGTSLTTFYNHCQEWEQTVLFIRTTNNEVFGAYCSASWEERLQGKKALSYFGTGESFIFTIKPKIHLYEWVGKSSQRAVPNTSHMFMSGDAKKISIGGGGGEALQLDEDLNWGRSEHCDTFNNQPLAEGKDFQCAELEAYCFEQ